MTLKEFEKDLENWKKRGTRYGKRPVVLLNKTGFYFEKVTAILEDTLKYPDYEYLLKNIQTIIKSDKIIFLYETQEKELKLLKTYLPVFEPRVYIGMIIDHFYPEVHYRINTDMLELAKKSDRYFWLSCFVFNHLHHENNWNPTYFYSCTPVENMWDTLDLSGIKNETVQKYIAKEEFPEPVVFLELMTSELMDESTKESTAIKFLMKYKEMEESKLNVSKEFLEILMRQGVIYRPRKGVVTWI